ncbi:MULTISPECIES: hypothetical protein [Paraburkholderia]|uniref:Porin n=1 Tax=Paraburkholderia madseniana TaxID=2599607 RepID=A0AAP5BN24_9BURK|nr:MULTISPECIES: hypothetical protein [Paraburkholderia]MCX4150989.1 hypothetical protein [Paraburkholderia madseniana]MCX4176629.1 hypothetical protein [Paraburkholderia madseniana]MDN7153922.1 hypothetical protein [Paraburkholderia sp. WS6]MDQ6412804.1 hypothetical protein [Paraburkholderia madseniana]MDQ6464621.1 hypothetical protein [Paraburkholderia madseniana]
MTTRNTLIAIAATLLCSAAHADEAITAANNEVSISFGANDLLYHELDNAHVTGGKYADSEQGSQPAVQVAAVRQGSIFGLEGIYTSAAVTVASGHTNYTGYQISLTSPSGIGAPVQTTTSMTEADVALKLGRAFMPLASRRLQVTPYLTYEFHVWERGTNERYSNSMAGIGLMAQYSITHRVVLSADVTYGKTFGVLLQSMHGLDERLGSRPSRSASLGVDYAVTPRTHIKASYQVTSFGYGQSNYEKGVFAGMQGTWYEPTSRTIQQRVLVGIAHSF